jgi:hypothetical protein
MRLTPCRRRKRVLLASIMLVAFALRAVIPQGFMLGGDRPFSIEICWDGFPAAMLAHDESRQADSMYMDSMDMGSMDMGAMQGGHPHSASEHCVFGSACSAAPTPHVALPSDFSSAQLLPAAESASIAGAVRLVHLPQSRAPPGQPS